MDEDWKASGDVVGKVQQDCLCQHICQPMRALILLRLMTKACGEGEAWGDPNSFQLKAALPINTSAHIAQM